MKTPRIRREQRGDHVVWIKCYSDSGRRKRMALLRRLARGLGANALLAPIPLSAEAACATERSMIGRLQALGVRVPTIVEFGERMLVLSDLGPTLASCCREAKTTGEVATLVTAGFAALADLHRRGGYLSQAFARNLTFSQGLVGFIDLEEDPVPMMSLVAAQARDTLFYVHSTARFLAGDRGCFQRLLDDHLQHESAQVRAEVFSSARRLSWLSRLTRPFGTRARGVGLAIEHLNRAAAA